MIRKTAEGITANPRAMKAANEEFAGMELSEAAGPSGRAWDPYEVWRTRVKHRTPAVLEAELAALFEAPAP